MIASIELEYRLTSGECTRETDRAHRSFSPARHEAHHLDVRHSLADQLAKLDLELRRHPERSAAAHRFVERIENHRMCVTKHQRSPGKHIVDVLFSISVPDSRTFSARGNYRIAADSAKGSDR